MAEIRIVCTGCQAALKVSNPAAFGKTIACPKCKAPVKVPAPTSAQGPVPARPPARAEPPPRPVAKQRPAKDEAFDDIDAGDAPPSRKKPGRRDEAIEDAPRKRHRDEDDVDARPARGRAVPRDDNDEDDRDRGRDRGRKDDYDEEDRPRPAEKKAAGKSVLDWLVIGVTAVAAVAYVVCLVLSMTGKLTWTPGGDDFKPKAQGGANVRPDAAPG